MSYLIFALVFIAGLLIAFLMSDKFSLGELLGLPFILGLGYASFAMFFMDAVRMGITYGHLLAVLVASIIVMGGALFFLVKKSARSFEVLKSGKISFGGLNFVWGFFICFGIYLAYNITVKCLYWPDAEFDSILGYDLLAKAIAHEGTIANSVLLNPAIVADCGPRLLYPPLYSSCNAICYMSGMDSPKLITAIFFVSWLVLFYSLVKRFASHTAAAITTFFMMIAPEMFANASFALTNLPTAIYAATAVIAFYTWREQKIQGFFYLSLVAFIFATWTRSDGIVFYPPMMLILLYDAWQTKKLKNLLSFGIISVIPFVLWHFYLTAHIERQQDSFFIKSLFFDGKKLKDVFGAAWTMLSNTSLYGVITYVFLAVLALLFVLLPAFYLADPNGNFIKSYKQSQWKVLGGVVLVGFILYFIQPETKINIQIPETFDPKAQTSDLIFCFYALIAVLLLVVLPVFYSIVPEGSLVKLFKQQYKYNLLLVMMGGWLLYTLLFYQMKNTDGSLFASGGWMLSGYKRGMFSFVPLAAFYCATNALSIRFFEWVDELMSTR